MDAGAKTGSAKGLSNGGRVGKGDEVGPGSGRKRRREEGDGDHETMAVGTSVKGWPRRKHQEQRRGLPIFAHKAGIIRAVKEHQVRSDLPLRSDPCR